MLNSVDFRPINLNTLVFHSRRTDDKKCVWRHCRNTRSDDVIRTCHKYISIYSAQARQSYNTQQHQWRCVSEWRIFMSFFCTKCTVKKNNSKYKLTLSIKWHLSILFWFSVTHCSFQHIILAIKVAIAYCIPDTPKWVEIELAKIAYKSKIALQHKVFYI